jgi:hypothetical protein
MDLTGRVHDLDLDRDVDFMGLLSPYNIRILKIKKGEMGGALSIHEAY